MSFKGGKIFWNFAYEDEREYVAQRVHDHVDGHFIVLSPRLQRGEEHRVPVADSGIATLHHWAVG